MGIISHTRLFLRELEGQLPFQLVDMNDLVGTLSFQEIAGFQAVIMLPHGPNALRLSDMYSVAIPSVVPAEPLAYRLFQSLKALLPPPASN
eukprot:6345239-Amphidinium_carterae.1